jgi:hypothetical protein
MSAAGSLPTKKSWKSIMRRKQLEVGLKEIVESAI